jgi:hypothetical protein
MMSIRNPTSHRRAGFVIITCDVIEPIKRDVGRTNPAEESSTRTGV